MKNAKRMAINVVSTLIILLGAFTLTTPSQAVECTSGDWTCTSSTSCSASSDGCTADCSESCTVSYKGVELISVE